MEERDYYRKLRKQKEIRLESIAQALKCSVSLISRYENKQCLMSEDKERRYKDYINNHNH